MAFSPRKSANAVAVKPPPALDQFTSAIGLARSPKAAEIGTKTQEEEEKQMKGRATIQKKSFNSVKKF